MKNKDITKKEESSKNKEFFCENKVSDVEIKNLECNAKLNETNSKQGKKIKIEKIDISNKTKKGKFLRLVIVCTIFLALALIIYFALKQTGTLDKLKSLEDVKQFILSGGNYSLIIFVIIQFLQVTVLPIPAAITTIAGALIFGPWMAFLLSFVSIFLGSLFAFWLGRRYGKKILIWICGKEDATKWTNKLTNGKYAFFLMMLFPAFPDDILCIAAGVTNMSTKFFAITNLITRPIGIFCLCFLGSGKLIPYSGYYLIIWAFIAIFVIVLFILSIKYSSKIEELVDKLANKHKIKVSKKAKKTSIETLPIDDGESDKNVDE